MKRALVLGLLSLVACAARPPAHWAEGGARIDIQPARWVYGDTSVEIQANGDVLFNGEPELSLDRVGRVYDPEGHPMGLLEPDGRLTGPADEPLGFVGAMSASRPGERTAWVALHPTGEAVVYDGEGGQRLLGVWVGGCHASLSAHQVCTLVTHLLGDKMRSRRGVTGMPYGPGMMGPGLGVGVPIR